MIKKIIGILMVISMTAAIIQIPAAADNPNELFFDDFEEYNSLEDMSEWYFKDNKQSVNLINIGDEHGNALAINNSNGVPAVAMSNNAIEYPVVSGEVNISYDIYLEAPEEKIWGLFGLVSDGQSDYGSRRIMEVYCEPNGTPSVRSGQDINNFANIECNKWYKVNVTLNPDIESGAYEVALYDGVTPVWSYAESAFDAAGSWKNINFSSWGGCTYYVDNVNVTYEPEQVRGSYTVSYDRTAVEKGFAEGTVTITPSSDMTNAKYFFVHWGNDEGILDDFTPIGSVMANGTQPVTIKIRSELMIPKDATKIFVAVQNGGNTPALSVSANIPQEALISFGEEIFSFQVISETHATTDEETKINPHNEHIRQTLKDIAENDSDSSGIFVNGDIVDGDTTERWTNYKKIVAETVGDTIPMYYTIGNHELRPHNGNVSEEEEHSAHIESYKQNTNTEELYYLHKINGQYFIHLGNEMMINGGDTAYLGQEQIQWLENQLDMAEAEGTRAYVFLHQPLANTVSSSFPYTGSPARRSEVAQDAELRAIFDSHPNTIVFTGHGHREFGSSRPALLGGTTKASYFDDGAIAYLVKDSSERIVGAQGLYVEVYSDRVVVRGRDFLSKKWVSSAQFMVPADKTFAHNYGAYNLKTDENGVKVSVTGTNETAATIIAAIYKSDGTLCGVKSQELPAKIYNEDEITINIDTTDAAYASVYIWDSIKGMMPVGKQAIQYAKDIVSDEMNDVTYKVKTDWDTAGNGAESAF